MLNFSSHAANFYHDNRIVNEQRLDPARTKSLLNEEKAVNDRLDKIESLIEGQNLSLSIIQKVQNKLIEPFKRLLLCQSMFEDVEKCMITEAMNKNGKL